MRNWKKVGLNSDHASGKELISVYLSQSYWKQKKGGGDSNHAKSEGSKSGGSYQTQSKTSGQDGQPQ
ncbi:hypothetical protein PILCRDRAFT_14781 [Piloderma croceum F 1598]|uniref:Uncharacterized protein n=1 Tax=Piloderma croceum (strain F 1598) TaxID=765440 RepID=A0A0C3B9F4_PILCF|nr:hypothetical protein PILCRDRAFT_14781 [Piloderma croceum F 1598]